MSDNVLLASASPAATPAIEAFVARGKAAREGKEGKEGREGTEGMEGTEGTEGNKGSEGEAGQKNRGRGEGGEEKVAVNGERLLEPSSIIDFGTLILGDPLYDLIMLHVSAQRCNKADLTRLLASYKPPLPAHGGAHFTQSYRAMCYTLLHQNDALSRVFRYRKELADAKSLEEIAAAVWGHLDEQV
ncbi:hypothetical protein CLOM_g12934 [Closterium sp. NIES-68]|nr:hypothetical protein CLOM_g17110 [Closterium sp. NIES-68]GJP48482.1 hypothetical protein CLOM_g7770 [Closterium sp. NIES-68]GJP53797.1 hypothetical protein CLOM_g12934 [Closterium sp. NIES-68]